MDCTLAEPNNTLANPPYLIHNWFNEEARNASLDRKGIATNARELGLGAYLLDTVVHCRQHQVRQSPGSALNIYWSFCHESLQMS